MKQFFIFFLGLIAGVALSIGGAYLYSNLQEDTDKLVYFDKPGKVIESEYSFRVIQVVDENSAIVVEQDISSIFGFGLTALLVHNNAYFYDNQEIEIGKKQQFRQVGVYIYMTTEGEQKTIPVIKIFNKNK
ncbi:MAG: hypothetical protein IIW70_07465 [Bacteroidales bacterium]|nr:hypothetical protein [Bacteroidales bacterium]